MIILNICIDPPLLLLIRLRYISRECNESNKHEVSPSYAADLSISVFFFHFLVISFLIATSRFKITRYISVASLLTRHGVPINFFFCEICREMNGTGRTICGEISCLPNQKCKANSVFGWSDQNLVDF